MSNLMLLANAPAPDSESGWENQSYPIGNGYLGANIFGCTDRERVQITENSLENPGYMKEGMMGGLNNFAELYFKLGHDGCKNYRRTLDIEDSMAIVEYDCNDIHYRREYFASYPDRVLVMRFSASKAGALSFTIAPEVPFIKDYALHEGDYGGKTGKVCTEGDTVTLSGTMEYYNIHFEGQLKVLSNDGTLKTLSDSLEITEATEVVMLFAVGTNYEVGSLTAINEKNRLSKLRDFHPHEKVNKIINDACCYDYQQLKSRHIADYTALFGRVTFEIEGDNTLMPTAELLNRYRDGEKSRYLEKLYFQYGRYLLISSSRKGGLPANMQGIWNCHDISKFGSGYWHCINVQMNYWPAFSTNIAETFEPYVDYYKSYLLRAQQIASSFIKKIAPDEWTEKPGECGWMLGTGAYPYHVQSPVNHSGIGMGGLTTKLFWDYYDFTQSREILEKVTYPALLGMSKFFFKSVKEYDGKYLSRISTSPQQMINGRYVNEGSYYMSVGSAFDQQMIYENGLDLVKAAETLDISNDDVEKQRNQIDCYDPVIIGWDGQIKEFREENFYGEIGEYEHRHISQLVALQPGTLIGSETGAWMDAAVRTLLLRGEKTTGGALAHRFNAWARTGDGNHAYSLLDNMLRNKTLNNLWDTHPPFQIDGNFGATAGIAEMLLQSHEGFIHILPALPDEWQSGSYSGLAARGGFEVAVKWSDGSAVKIVIHSKSGNSATVKYPLISKAEVTDSKGRQISFHVVDKYKISFETEMNESYTITSIPATVIPAKPTGFTVDSSNLQLRWNHEQGLVYNIYRAIESAPVYEKIGSNIYEDSFVDSEIDFDSYETVSYCLRAYVNGFESTGATVTINHATELQKDIYNNVLHGKN